MQTLVIKPKGAKIKPSPQTKVAKIFRMAFCVMIALLVVTELLLRFGLGFCNAVLYRTDPDFEYIAIPQDTKRLGNHIFYNSFSQRSEEVTSADSVIVLGFGDSVINGGTQVDNDNLATTKLSDYLTHKTHKKVKVLNISSQSWGPDNCYAYLTRYGNFKAKAMFLVLSSHDAYDDMDFQEVVGKDLSFPDKQYPLAILELVDRYLIPKLFPSKTPESSNNGVGIDKRKPTTAFNPGIAKLYQYAKQHKLPFLIYLHADTDELQNRTYTPYGRLIVSFCSKNNIPLIKELDQHLLTKAAYRDGIHLNSLGQDQMYKILRDKVYN